jgi:glycogen operon protein
VPGVKLGQTYAFRIVGSFDLASGLYFDPSKLLLDPYGRRVIVPRNYSREAASHPGDNIATAMKNMPIDPDSYDWEGDHTFAHTIVADHHL